MNNHRYILMVILGAAVVIGVTVNSLAVDVLARVDSGDPAFMGLSLSAAAALLSAIVSFFVFLRSQRAYLFVDETVTELRRVSWPGREETVRSTAVVIGFTFIVAGALAFYDYLWATVTRAVLFNAG